MNITILRPPAITTGLILFYVLLYSLGLLDSMILTSNALFHLDLNRLSFYPLVFVNFLHLLVGVVVFTPLCAQFELACGTVRTGIVLNVAAVIPGVLDNIIVKLTGERIGTKSFCGTSSWILLFSAFLSLNCWSLPVIPINRFIIGVPAWILPVLLFAAITLVASDFWLIHLLALCMGFGLGTGHLGFLVDGTTGVVAWIESKIEPGINILRYIVRFVGELEARELRRSKLTRARGRSIVAADEIPMPAAGLTNPIA